MRCTNGVTTKFSGRAKVIVAVTILNALLVNSGTAGVESRIKDLAYLKGTTAEPLIGYGLVVGLNGTGDGTSAENTSNSIASMLEKLDISVNPADRKAKNVRR